MVRIQPHERASVIAGTRAVAQRMVNAENRFVEFAMEAGNLTHEQATKALAVYRKVRAVQIHVGMGQFTFTHGAFGDADVLRRAAGIEETK